MTQIDKDIYYYINIFLLLFYRFIYIFCNYLFHQFVVTLYYNIDHFILSIISFIIYCKLMESIE